MVAVFSAFKPVISIFFKPIVENLITLKNRMTFNEYSLRAALAAISCDSMARYELLETVSPTGYYSCNVCNREGLYCKCVSFPLVSGQEYSFRTMEEWKAGNHL